MKSILHSKADRTCYLCMALHGNHSVQTILEEHHVIYGRGRRKLSTKYGLMVYLCPLHHRGSYESIHDNTKRNKKINADLKEYAQKRFIDVFPELNFIEIFGKNYINNPDKKPATQSKIEGFTRMY